MSAANVKTASGKQANPAAGDHLFLHRDPLPLFRRPHSDLYGDARGLAQRAGVAVHELVPLVARELVDNALDQCDVVGAGHAGVTIERDGTTIIVTDRAGGIPGDDRDIVGMFSLDAPLTSRKLLPAPRRGALGAGLRLVCGLVACCSGTIDLQTRGCRYVLRPGLDGTEMVQSDPVLDFGGTRIALNLDAIERSHPEIALGLYVFDAMARPALRVAAAGAKPAWTRGPSAHWIDGPRWRSLLRAAPAEMTVRQLVETLDRCSGSKKSGDIAAELKGRPCRSLTEAEALAVLERAKAATKAPGKDAFAALGRDAVLACHGYAAERALDGAGRPVLVEAWAALRSRKRPEHSSVQTMVNRTVPPGAEMRLGPATPKGMALWGLGVDMALRVPLGAYTLVVCVTAPVVPITSDAKTPSLKSWRETIAEAAGAALRSARKNGSRDLDPDDGEDEDDAGDAAEPKPPRITKRVAILERLAAAAEAAGSNGQFQFGQRNLYYRMRDWVAKVTGSELSYGYFTSVVTDYEAEHGEIPGMLRDARGSYTLPHRGRSSIALGASEVAAFQRPPWLFSNLLVVEKEDAIEILRAAGFLDRWDCAALSAKGMTTRAARDLVDKIAANGSAEPVRCYVLHDADAAGSVIASTLQNATKARGARTVQVFDLGLHPWSSTADGLAVETFERGDRRRPVAQSILDYDLRNGTAWEEWLQTHRVELNALGSAELVEWLDRAFAEAGAARVQPPDDVLNETLQRAVRESIEASVKATVMRRVSKVIERRVVAAIDKIEWPEASTIRDAVAGGYSRQPEDRWTRALWTIADQLAGGTA